MLYRNASAFPVATFRDEIDRLFEDTFGAQNRRRGWVPAVDVRENGREYTFEVELPGVAPEAVDVTADNGVLTVRGEKSSRTPREGDEGRVHFVERSYGSFVRAFQLPQGVEEDGISAEFDHGVLTVHVPKAARPQPRKINVAAGGGRVSGGQTQERVGAGGEGRGEDAAPAESGRKETAARRGAAGGSDR